MADNNAAPVIDQVALSALDARQRVFHIHQEVTDLLHFQSHIRLQGLIAPLPPTTGPLNDETREKLAAAIRKEQKVLHAIRLLIERAEECNRDVLDILEDTTDNGWNNQAWQA